MSDWMEKELRHHLRPVPAPDALWDRIQASHLGSPKLGGPKPRAARNAALPLQRAWFLPVCAGMLVLLTAGLLSGIRQSRTHLRDIAQLSDPELSALADLSSGDAFASDSPVRIRDWVKARSSIDVELPSSRSEAIHLLGAKLVQVRGSLIAAVSYKVGPDSATLLVSRPAACCNAGEGSKHLISKTETPGGTSLTSWNMREQAYTIAYAGTGESQGACQLCHADSRVRL